MQADNSLSKLNHGRIQGRGRLLRTPPLHGFDPLPTQRYRPPLVIFKNSIFGRLTLDNRLTPAYTNFKGENAPKQNFFLSNFSKKSPKTAFLTPVFFSKISLRHKNFCPNRLFIVFWDRSCTQFCNPSPSANPRSTPDHILSRENLVLL